MEEANGPGGAPGYAELEARYQGVIEAAVDAIVIIDADGTIETFNPAAERIFGYRAEEVLGRSVNVLMPEPDATRHDGYMRHYMGGGPPQIIGRGREVVGRRKNGQTFPMDLAVGEIKGQRRRRFVGTLRDISRRRLVEQALAAREEELRLIFDNAPIGIFTGALNGRFTKVNPALCALVDYAAEDLLRMSMADLTLEEDRERLKQAVLDLVEGLRAEASCPLRWLGRGGEELAVTLQAVLARSASGAAFLIGQVVDRTAQLRSERESRDARERLAHVGRVTTLGEMASAIAHEINQPLTAISAYAQASRRLLGQGEPDLALLGETLEAIAAQALRAGDVVRRIRGFVSNREGGRQQAGLNEILASVLELAAIDAHSNRVTITTRLGSHLPAVLVDPVQLQQVCLNLIRNAIDAMLELPESERQLDIESGATDGRVWARFVDRGPGVAPTMRERLFQPFQTTKTEGMGMGLSISNSIIAAHGGSLHYADAPTGGAVFTISLPAATG